MPFARRGLYDRRRREELPVGRKVALGLIAAALSVGAGAGVAFAATQGAAKPAKIPVKSPAAVAVHRCHDAPASVAL